MQETPTGLLLGGVIFLILLFIGIFAAVIVYVRQSQDSSQEPAKGQGEPQPRRQAAQQTEPVAPARRDIPAPEPVPPVDVPARPGEVMRVIRDQQTGRVLVEVDGKQYANIREIADAQVGRRVLWAIADLVRFTGGMATNPQAMRSIAPEAPTRQPEPEPAQPASASLPDRIDTPPPTQPRQAETASPLAPLPRPRPALRTNALTAEEKSRERYSLLGYFRKGFVRDGGTDLAASPVSFIDEIEAILQRRIEQLPTPLGSEVHVLTGVGGALQIEVGYAVYDSPDEVPDPQIRQLIKDAVAEWEKS
jgi:hypothetical protein